jgi:hypothetical protein
MNEREDEGGHWYNLNDPELVQAFDTQLLEALQPSPAAMRRAWQLFAVDHRALWNLVKQHGNLGFPTRARIVRRERTAPVVEVRQTQPGGVGRIIFSIDSLELIGWNAHERLQ